jgi:hypothetical protein
VIYKWSLYFHNLTKPCQLRNCEYTLPYWAASTGYHELKKMQTTPQFRNALYSPWSFSTPRHIHTNSDSATLHSNSHSQRNIRNDQDIIIAFKSRYIKNSRYSLYFQNLTKQNLWIHITSLGDIYWISRAWKDTAIQKRFVFVHFLPNAEPDGADNNDDDNDIMLICPTIDLWITKSTWHQLPQCYLNRR